MAHTSALTLFSAELEAAAEELDDELGGICDDSSDLSTDCNHGARWWIPNEAMHS